MSRHSIAAGRCRPPGTISLRAIRDRRYAEGDDQGMTLVELLIASSLLIMLLTLVLVTMNVFINLSDAVTSQYKEFDQTLPALQPLQTLLRGEVEPAPYAYPPTDTQPTNTSPPTPGFASVGNFALTFYANVGNSNGPAKIVAEELNASGNPVSTSPPLTVCSTTSLCSFQVQEFLPLTVTGVSTCPGTGSGPTCQYSLTPDKILANVNGVVNNPSTPDASTGGAIFSYNIFDPYFNITTNINDNLSFVLSADMVTNQTITGLHTIGYTMANASDTTSLATCTLPTPTHPSLAVSCPTDAIQSVGIYLMVSNKGAGTNGQVEYQTIVYRTAESTGSTTYPFEYTAAVG